jgi:UDP-N-acetylglucosamine 2-epimerase
MFGLVSKSKYNDLKQEYERLHRMNRERSDIHVGYNHIIDSLNNNIKELKEEITYLNSEVLRLKSEKE